ncbi:MAG: 3-phosphoserine/phosphohydroxythreonine aminotransferase [Deltaproteobacteria bacterium]|nr:MAG: 3-phosphoserine/phosphohydroxythreonine aminotransferase [Deltaproteobacteria bacterium]
MEKRIFNFNPGPAVQPLSVLKKIQNEFSNYKNLGMSIIEISHRSKDFMEILDSAKKRVKRLYNLDENWNVIFVPGGASLQFAMVPMNLLQKDDIGEYINTGTWSSKAIHEAEIQGKNIKVTASSEDKAFSYIPKNFNVNKKSKFLHITTNNTIRGTQWHKIPDFEIPVIADMCSDILSRPVDMEKFGLIYAGIQKNIGPSGTAIVIVHDKMLGNIPDNIPTMLNYKTYVKKDSMHNTPSTFSIYCCELILKWIEEEMGGLEKMEALNIKKAAYLYEAIDSSNDFYVGTAEKEDRSLMNVTFRLKNQELEKKFIELAFESGLGGLKGHRSAGGIRASIYNAMPEQGVIKLAEFMETFQNKNS